MASYKKIINKQKKKAKIFLQKYYEYNSISSQKSCQWRMIPKNLPPTIHINKQSKEINKQETSTPNKRSKNTTILQTSNTQRAKQSVSLQGGFPRPPWRSVKKNRVFPVKNEKLFERSEFFSFREMPDFLASERQPALFLFVSFSFVRTKGKRKTLQLEQNHRQHIPHNGSNRHMNYPRHHERVVEQVFTDDGCS